jgi:hypothetical protein
MNATRITATIRVDLGGFDLVAPFLVLRVGSGGGSRVETRGIEPLTSTLQR